MERPVWREISDAEIEQPRRRSQPRRIFRMRGPLELLPKMDEGAGDLDEALEKSMVCVARVEPEMFEHIVSLVVVPRIETREPADVMGIVRNALTGRAGVQASHHVFDA